jgi:wbnE
MKYRVIHVTGGVRNTISGVQSFIKNHIKTDDEEFEYMVGESNGESYFPFNKYLDEKGIKRIVFPSLKVSNMVRYVRECRDFYENNRIDILHVHNPITAFIHNYYAKINGVKVRIYHNHSSQFSDTIFKSIRNRFLVFLALRNATHRLSCGNLAGIKIFGNKSYQIVPNAIDINKYKFSLKYRKEIREEFHIEEHQKVVGMIGILNRFKNQNFLIEIAKKLSDVTFLFVGEGPDRVLLEEKSKDLTNVIFTGKREDAYKFYSAFDIFAFPSLYEGFPMVLIEAQCSGVNIIMNETIDSTTKVANNICTALPLEKNKWIDYIEKVQVNNTKRDFDKRLMAFDINQNIINLKEIYQKGLKK